MRPFGKTRQTASLPYLFRGGNQNENKNFTWFSGDGRIYGRSGVCTAWPRRRTLIIHARRRTLVIHARRRTLVIHARRRKIVIHARRKIVTHARRRKIVIHARRRKIV